MSENKVNVKVVQDAFSEPFRAKPVGFRTILVAGATVGMWLALTSISSQLQESNQLRKMQLDIARRQYVLDSLQFEHLKQIHRPQSQR